MREQQHRRLFFLLHFPAQILLLPVMMMPNTSKVRGRADSGRRGAKTGCEDGGDDEEESAEWSGDRNIRGPTVPTESRKSSCHVSSECRRTPQETSSAMPLQTCRYIMNEGVILFLMVQPVSSRALCADDRKSLDLWSFDSRLSLFLMTG